MNIKTKLIAKNSAARSGYPMVPKYITIHNTGNVSYGANAKAHANYLQNSGKNETTSYHYVVDDKEIYKLLPDNEVSWHAGDGENGIGNRQSLSIEICENADGDLLQATNNAVELTAHLMKTYNIPLSNVVQHNKWSGKNCPSRIRKGEPYNWQTFLNNVQAIVVGSTNTTATSMTLKAGTKLIMSNVALYVSATTLTQSATKTGTYYIWSDEAINNRVRITNNISNVGKLGQVTGWIGVSDAKKSLVDISYKVKVTTDSLRIRAGAGLNYKIVGCINDRGVYTIVETKNGWGRLKSGKGWIYLFYTKKI